MLTTYSHQDFNAREAKIPGDAIQVANQQPKRAKTPPKNPIKRVHYPYQTLINAISQDKNLSLIL